jgi:hypothetical protein
MGSFSFLLSMPGIDGGDEQKALGSINLGFQPFDAVGLSRIVVLVIERQIVELNLLE